MPEWKDWNEQVIAEFRATGGKVGGTFEGATLLLLHTTGANTGLPRVTPLVYQQVGEDVAVFGSKGGAPTHPAWYLNLLTNPDAEIEIGSETVPVRARVAEGEERERIFETQKQRYPNFADYEKTTQGRQIPVVILTRTD